MQAVSVELLAMIVDGVLVYSRLEDQQVVVNLRGHPVIVSQTDFTLLALEEMELGAYERADGVVDDRYQPRMFGNVPTLRRGHFGTWTPGHPPVIPA